jgi:acyl-coenzyme A thioesterase PaaI-like protein
MIPQARFVDVADATHMVAGDRNDAFTSAVLDFAAPLLIATPNPSALLDVSALPDPENLATRGRLANAMRALNHTFVRHLASTADIAAAAEQLEQLQARLRQGPPRMPATSTGANRYIEPLPADGDLLPTSPERAIAGGANPYGLPLEVWYRAPWVETELTLGAAHEGANSLAHGGVVACIFDDVTGRVQSTIGIMAVTGRLTINYLAGVPLDTPLVFRARLARRDGRKLFVEADAHHHGQLLATAESVWIQIPSERLGLPAGLRAG